MSRPRPALWLAGSAQSTLSQRGADERILPLINVVFLLLIFFMIAGRLSLRDPFPIELPSSTSETGAVDGDLEIQIAADGRLGVNGATLSGDDLQAQLKSHMTSGQHLQVRIKADAAADAQEVVKTMALLGDLGLSDVDLLTVLTRP